MNVLLVAINYSWSIGFENLGIERISAFLKLNNCNVEVIYLYETDSIQNSLDKLNICNDSIIGFSVYSQNLEYASMLANKIKNKNKESVIFWGSRFVSDCAVPLAEKYGQIVDFFVLGHGEYSIFNFLNKYKENIAIDEIIKKNPNLLSYKNKENKFALNININELPWPERNFLLNHKSLHAYIADAHDCTGRCSFCSGNTTHWSGRNAQDIFDEVISVYNKTKIRSFFFTSGSFEDPGKKGKDKIKQFCEIVLSNNIRFAFGCYLRAETFHNTEEDLSLLRLMKKAGFYNVFVGIEAGNKDDLILFNKRATLEDNYRSIELFRKVEVLIIMDLL